MATTTFVPGNSCRSILQSRQFVAGKQEFAHRVRDFAAAPRTNRVHQIKHADTSVQSVRLCTVSHKTIPVRQRLRPIWPWPAFLTTDGTEFTDRKSSKGFAT